MNDLISSVAREVKSRANVPLLAKAMLTDKSTTFWDVAGHHHAGKIIGIRPEGGKGMWLIKTKDGEWCVRCMDGDYSYLSKWKI